MRSPRDWDYTECLFQNPLQLQFFDRWQRRWHQCFYPVHNCSFQTSSLSNSCFRIRLYHNRDSAGTFFDSLCKTPNTFWIVLNPVSLNLYPAIDSLKQCLNVLIPKGSFSNAPEVRDKCCLRVSPNNYLTVPASASSIAVTSNTFWIPFDRCCIHQTWFPQLLLPSPHVELLFHRILAHNFILKQ